MNPWLRINVTYGCSQLVNKYVTVRENLLAMHG